MLVLSGTALAVDGERRAVVLVFDRGADANTAVRIERDLRNMYDFSVPKTPKVLEIEPRYDVGNLQKGNLGRAERHFNDAQRALAKEDAEEAHDQLFRAERFYKKAMPYSADSPLLRGIYFYGYLADKLGGAEEKAKNRYCEYVALTRNLAGSAGPIEQFEPLADKCGETQIAGTAELKVRANVDGAHVYVDERRVGVVGRELPYVNPFISAGPHIVEVRTAGYVRWGTLLNLKNGASQSVRAKLKEARNRKEDYDPLAGLVFRGEDAFSEDYIADLMFTMAEQFRVTDLVVGYLDRAPDGRSRLSVFCHGEEGVDRYNYAFAATVDAHRGALKEFWKARFGEALEPADALPAFDRWSPTLFKVE